MKKYIALVLAVSMMFMLAGCCVVSYKGIPLNTQCTQDDNVTITNPAEDSKSNTDSQTQPCVVPENVPTNNASLDNMLNVLTNQANSQNYENWLSVAKCKYATEEHLLKVAKNAKYSSFTGVAEAILENPNTTEAVLKMLVDNSDTDFIIVYKDSDRINKSILMTVANSNKATEDVLVLLAHNAYCYDDSELAKSVIENPSVTEKAVKNNHSDTIGYIASSNKATEDVLLIVVKYVINYNDEAVAAKVIENVNVTLAVLEKMSESNNSTIANMAHKAVEAKIDQ